MKKIINMSLMMALMTILTLSFNACGNDDDNNNKQPAPQITLNEANIDGFHVHVDIAGKNVDEGDVLKMSVTDAVGQTANAEKDITAEDDDDEE